MIEIYCLKKAGRSTEALLRLILSERLGSRPDPAEWKIVRSGRGKPAFASHPEVFISVTDCGAWWACAFSDAPVGIDLDGPRSRAGETPEEKDRRLGKLAERFFSADEAEYVRGKAPEPDVSAEHRFFRVWTAKEAFVKYTGTGIDAGFGRFSVLPGAEGGEALPDRWKACGVWFSRFSGPAGESVLTVCGRRKEKIVFREARQDERFMREAVRQAKKAEAIGEVPIGCVIVRGGEIISRGYNRRTTEGSTLAHAEITAIRRANRVLGDWRLEGCRMYVTLEPCPMCAGALVQSRIDEVVIGCMNPKAGSAGSVVNLLQMKGFNHRVEIRAGVLGEACSEMLRSFFREMREKKSRKTT